MKQVTVDFKQRLKLAEVLGAMKGTLAELDSYAAAYQQLKFTEAESESVGLISEDLPNGGKTFGWNPDADLSTLTIELILDNQDAARVKAIIPNFGGWEQGDREWLKAFLGAL